MFPQKKKKKKQEKCPQKSPHEKCPQGRMPTWKKAHKEKCPQGKMPTRKNMPTMKNAHMYSSFKIVTGMIAFLKNSEKRKRILQKLAILIKMREKGRRTKRITIYAYIFIQFKMDNTYMV